MPWHQTVNKHTNISVMRKKYCYDSRWANVSAYHFLFDGTKKCLSNAHQTSFLRLVCCSFSAASAVRVPISQKISHRWIAFSAIAQVTQCLVMDFKWFSCLCQHPLSLDVVCIVGLFEWKHCQRRCFFSGFWRDMVFHIFAHIRGCHQASECP